MNIGVYSFYDIYNINNKLFKKESFSIGNDLGFPFRMLKEALFSHNCTFNTLDLIDDKELDAVIFLDFPTNSIDLLLSLQKRKIRLYLILFECEIIKPDNWFQENHRWFSKIFTWNTSLVDNVKYFQYFWPNQINPITFQDKKRQLCTLIASNKTNADKKELYSKRLEIIKWFEKKHPKDFHLYGFGWENGTKIELPKFFKKVIKFVFKKQKIFIFCFTKTYKGTIDDKVATLSKYKFSICLENAIIPGYITEKIFDSLLSYTIPVYLGDPEIQKYIPKNCFIDLRNFKNINALYTYMKRMEEKEYLSIISSITNFLNSEEIKKFSALNFVDIISKQII